MTNIFGKAGLRDLRDNGCGSMIEQQPEPTKEAVARMLREYSRGCSESGKNPSNCGVCFDAAVEALLSVTTRKQREACERIADMLQGDDGEAWFEAEKFLKAEAPDLYDAIGLPADPLPDFPEPNAFERLQAWVLGGIVGLLIRKPRK
ncbi:hypothetical protein RCMOTHERGOOSE_52 [Rhodobacter phage RcMotherGoose]|nr:hypothetical protein RCMOTHERGOOSE_52 [Rhodobacter phage RcMotherGoose]